MVIQRAISASRWRLSSASNWFVVRGALQYGAQFGGMLNYVTRQAGPKEGISFETINSMGSHGLLSTYDALSGRFGRTNFRADYNKRVSDGYRDSSESDAQYYSFSLRHGFTDDLNVDLGYARSEYLYQLPGPLTDAMYRENPRQATRDRNYYSPDIQIPSLGVEWKVNEQTGVSWKSSAVLGQRNSVMFDRTADVVDAVDPITGQYSNRQVDIDDYQSYTSAAKILHRYDFAGREHALAAGIEWMDNDTRRRQQGRGTSGANYDLTLVQPGWRRDLRLKSKNLAFFVENAFALTDRWSVSPGLRFESGESELDGEVIGYVSADLPTTIAREFTLLGVSTEYALGDGIDMYAGLSTAYRPVLFKDIIPGSALERVDENLKDARGYTAEIGFRGERSGLNWDVSMFNLRYENRMGIVAHGEGADFYNLRTNVGDSENWGVEFFLQYAHTLGNALTMIIFTSSAWMDSQYDDATVRVGFDNVSVDGNRVQSTPEVTSRNGLTLRNEVWSATLLYSYTSQTYADALNTKSSSANGAVGLVPAYGVWDVSGSWRISSNVTGRATISNLGNEHYFTKRPEFYPGPGVWPSDGRSVNLSLAVAF